MKGLDYMYVYNIFYVKESVFTFLSIMEFSFVVILFMLWHLSYPYTPDKDKSNF